MGHDTEIHEQPRDNEPLRDSSGYRFFSDGDVGAAHALAHQMLDLGQYQRGHDLLKRWLDGRLGRGSRWVHLQWHMLVFELAVHEYESAEARFFRYILPAAATTADALTDAPAALWRLALAADRPIDLPWEVVRAAAIEHLWDTGAPYVTLHNLLALAGAGDVDTIDRWLTGHTPATAADHALDRVAFALRCFASGDYALSAAAFSAALPALSSIGGSRAQNDLFAAIYRLALELAASRGQRAAVH